MELSWWNFRTQEYDRFSGIPKDFSGYIPQDPAAQSLYNLLIEHKGKSPVQAAMHILDKVVGSKGN